MAKSMKRKLLAAKAAATTLKEKKGPAPTKVATMLVATPLKSKVETIPATKVATMLVTTPLKKTTRTMPSRTPTASAASKQAVVGPLARLGSATPLVVAPLAAGSLPGQASPPASPASRPPSGGCTAVRLLGEAEKQRLLDMTAPGQMPLTERKAHCSALRRALARPGPHVCECVFLCGCSWGRVCVCGVCSVCSVWCVSVSGVCRSMKQKQKRHAQKHGDNRQQHLRPGIPGPVLARWAAERGNNKLQPEPLVFPPKKEKVDKHGTVLFLLCGLAKSPHRLACVC